MATCGPTLCWPTSPASATATRGERAGEFDARWPMQYHFVGKDITRFHCVICRPAHAAGLPITHTVFGPRLPAHEGEKMSKSKATP